MRDMWMFPLGIVRSKEMVRENWDWSPNKKVNARRRESPAPTEKGFFSAVSSVTKSYWNAFDPNRKSFIIFVHCPLSQRYHYLIINELECNCPRLGFSFAGRNVDRIDGASLGTDLPLRQPKHHPLPGRDRRICPVHRSKVRYLRLATVQCTYDVGQPPRQRIKCRCLSGAGEEIPGQYGGVPDQYKTPTKNAVRGLDGTKRGRTGKGFETAAGQDDLQNGVQRHSSIAAGGFDPSFSARLCRHWAMVMLQAPSQYYDMEIGSKIFISEDVTPKNWYQRILYLYYNAYIEKVDFVNTRAATNRINNWVKYVTRQQIKDFLTTGKLVIRKQWETNFRVD